MMDKNFEISENPEILIDKNFDSRMVQLEGVKLGDDYKKIHPLLLDIVGVYIINSPDPYANFTQRIELFENYNGFVHMAGNFNFGIEKQKIIELRLYGKHIDYIKQHKQQKIIDVHGAPGKIWVIDDEDEKVLAYSDKKLYFVVDRYTEIINEVRVGDINEEIYSRWENI